MSRGTTNTESLLASQHLKHPEQLPRYRAPFHRSMASWASGRSFETENDVMRVWFLRLFVICGFLCFFENVSCFEERV